MIRVMYQWRVAEANRAAFRLAWERATTAIRDTVAGARGSILLESCDDPGTLVTIAHWDRLEQWEAFIGAAPTAQMKEMHALAELVFRQAFRLAGDHTI